MAMERITLSTLARFARIEIETGKQAFGFLFNPMVLITAWNSQGNSPKKSIVSDTQKVVRGPHARSLWYHLASAFAPCIAHGFGH